MKIVSYLIFFVLFSTKLFSQNGFDVYLNVPPSTVLISIAETTDGGFIACGSIMNSTDSTLDFYFSRYNASGNFLWQTQINDTDWWPLPTNDYATDIIVDFNGGFIFTGTEGDPNDFYNRTAIVGSLDSTGHFISKFYLQNGISSNGGNLRRFSDSTFILQYDNYYGAGNWSTAIVRFDQQFNTIWTSNGLPEYGNNNASVNPGQYSFTLGYSPGYYYSMNYFNQPVVSRINPSGIRDWSFVFTREAFSPSYPKFQAISSKMDNGMVICGTDSFPGNTQIFILNISQIGDSSGIRYYGSEQNEYANNISLCYDSGFIITGSAENICLTGLQEIFLFKIDQNGDSSWFKTFPGLNHNGGIKVFPTNEDGFLIFGYADSLYRIIKTDSLGNINSQNPYFISANQNCAVFCNGDTALLNLNIPAATYLWSTGETSSSIQVTQSGYYSVQVTDSNGLMFSVPYLNVIFLNSNSSSLGRDTTSCINNAIFLQMGLGFNSYLWQDSSTQSSFSLNSSIPDTFLIYCNALINGSCNVSDSVTIIYDICSDVSTIQNGEKNIHIYPNPFKDEITIHSAYPIDGKFIIRDELGKILFEEMFTENKNFNVSFLADGIYVVSIETERNVYVWKFVKMK